MYKTFRIYIPLNLSKKISGKDKTPTGQTVSTY